MGIKIGLEGKLYRNTGTYGYHLGSGSDEAYKAYIDYITTSEEQSLWNASQGICHQGDPWLVEHGGYGGQITWDRLVYAHDAGIRGPWIIYTDDDAPFWNLTTLAATQSFEQARTDLINMLAEFNATYGMIPGQQPGPGAWYL